MKGINSDVSMCLIQIHLIQQILPKAVIEELSINRNVIFLLTL